MGISTETKLYSNFIDGKWGKTSSGKTRPNLNPANTTEILGYASDSTKEDARKAIEAARKAFPSWRKTPAPKRAAILYKAASLMTERKEELASIITREEGKCPSEALGEVQRGINCMEFLAGEGRRLNGETIPSELPRNFCYTLREPLGVVSLITPWNFPVAIPCWKLATALVCGNTVVFKPASLTPWSAEVIVQIFQEAGLSPGVLNMVLGSGGEVGEEMVTHPDIAAISFTGSTTVGNRIAELAGKARKKVQLEMGGKNALIVLDDADCDLAISATILGAFGSTGQRCTATSRAIVQKGILEKFTSLLLEKTKKVQVGSSPNSTQYMGPLVDDYQYGKVVEYIETGKKEGAKLLYGGKPIKEGSFSKGYFVEPTIFTAVTPKMTIAQEEIFGPVLSIIEVKDLHEALAVSNDSSYGHSSSIFTSDANSIFQYVDEIEVGLVHINSATIGGEAQVPFGGIKGTGGLGGREMGSAAIDFFTEIKSVYVDYTAQARTSSVY